ncbi:MAG: hypothetical protein NTW29_08030 [Bacteroidetes bacterium]|nr:hypothetical protein [Bacteroidota bacterium]
MNTSFVVRPITIMLIASIFATSCNNNKEKENTNPAENKTSNEAATTTSASSEEPAEKAVVNFHVNDTAAATKKGAKNDTDPQLGLYTEASKQLSLDFMGDVPSRPHRGWLHFGIQNFKFEPATYTVNTDSYASYTRYTTPNAGGSSDYIADKNPENKGTEFTVRFTKIEKDPSGNGGMYLASGTFSCKLYNKVYSMKRDSKEELMISEGTFENIPIMGGPRD